MTLFSLFETSFICSPVNVMDVSMQIKEIRGDLRLKTEELRRQEDKAKNLLKEKQLLEQKIARLERNKTNEVC